MGRDFIITGGWVLVYCPLCPFPVQIPSGATFNASGLNFSASSSSSSTTVSIQGRWNNCSQYTTVVCSGCLLRIFLYSGNKVFPPVTAPCIFVPPECPQGGMFGVAGKMVATNCAFTSVNAVNADVGMHSPPSIYIFSGRGWACW